MFNDADGDDPDSDFEDPEITSPSSPVTYRVIIDNDSDHTVNITSISDAPYGAVCNSLIGQSLTVDDGDGAGSLNGGGDEITCTFVETAPSSLGATFVDTVTVVVQGSTGQASDSATVKTPPGGAVGGVVELHVASGGGPESASPADGSTAGRSYGPLAVGIAAGALMAATAAWYARRQSLR